MRHVALLLLVAGCVTRLAAQTASDPAPTIAVLDLRFDGEHANVLEPGDTAVAQAATSRLRATLAVVPGVTVTDSTRVTAAVAAAEADGNPCDVACAVAVGRRLGARWVARGTVTKTSNLVWVLSAALLDASSGQAVLADSYELKGDAMRMAPAGAHVFAQRIERAIAR